jgi:hypothetical protein
MRMASCNGFMPMGSLVGPMRRNKGALKQYHNLRNVNILVELPLYDELQVDGSLSR